MCVCACVRACCHGRRKVANRVVLGSIQLTLAENHSEMLLQFLDRLHSSPATNDIDRWLLWQPGSITMDEGRAVAGSLPQVRHLSLAGDMLASLPVLQIALTLDDLLDTLHCKHL